MTTYCTARRLVSAFSVILALAATCGAAAGQPPADNDAALPRVLILGDSISMGYTVPTRQLLAGVADVHRPKDNCGPTSRGVERIDAWLGDGSWDVIHFNWGLHDLKYIDDARQVPLEQYEKNLAQLVERLQETGAKLIWCSTTPVPKGCTPRRSNDDVLAYNAAAAKIMQSAGIPTDDLYTFANARLQEIQRPANVHFTPEGSKTLAKEVARHIRKTLETAKE